MLIVAVTALTGFVWRQPGWQRSFLRRAQARGVAHDVQLTTWVMQAQDQRPDGAGLLAWAVARDHGVDRAHALILDTIGTRLTAGGVQVEP